MLNSKEDLIIITRDSILKEKLRTQCKTHSALIRRCVMVYWSCYTLSEAWSGVNWADLMAAQATLGLIFITGLPER